MSKRFTDTDKWKKSLLKSMPAEYKLLWFYICDDCDHAGIWNVDIEVAALRIGEEVTAAKAIEVFGEKIKVFDGGEKWFIPGFIEFQYGELNEKNRVHESILKKLNKYKLLENKPLTSPLQGAKEEDKEEELEIKGGTGEKFLIPEMFSVFKKHLPNYPGDQEKDFQPLLAIANFIAKQLDTGPPVKNSAAVIAEWEKISTWLGNDGFYQTKTLKTISTHIQEIFQKKVNGNDQRIIKHGKSSGANELLNQFKTELGSTG